MSIDIKKAYDSVEHWVIRKTLGRNGLNLPEPFLNAIMDTLEATSIEIRVAGGLSKPCSIQRGVRQGHPISLLPFNLAIDPLLQRLEERNLETHALTGPHAYADDVDLAYFSHTALEATWQEVRAFLQVTHLEANAKKTIYVRNRLAEVNNHEAQLEIDGQPLAKLSATQPFRVLGVNFTTELDWKYEKTVAAGKFKGALKNVAKRAVTDIQLIEIINVMQLSALSYGMVVVPNTKSELIELNEALYRVMRRRLRITTDPKGWEDWMTLKREEGGLGLYNVKDLHDANHVNGLMLVVNGPDTPAKRALTTHICNCNMDMNEIALPETSPIQHVMEVIQDRNGTLHTAKRSANPVAILNHIADSSLMRQWLTTLPLQNVTLEQKTQMPLKNVTLEQKTQMLLKETATPWELREPVDLQRELNRVSAIGERVVTIAEAKVASRAIREAILRLKLESPTRDDAIRNLAHTHWKANTVEEVEQATRAVLAATDWNDVALPPLTRQQQEQLSKLLQKVSEATKAIELRTWRGQRKRQRDAKRWNCSQSNGSCHLQTAPAKRPTRSARAGEHSSLKTA